MLVTEMSNVGLKRELKVVLGASELGERFTKKLDELKDTVRLKGFRPGKVPVAHLRRVYGRSVMAEVVQSAVAETTQQALDQRKERPAMRPEIKLPEDKDEIERVIGGSADLAYTVSFEVLPAIALSDLSTLEVERPVAEVGEADVEKALVPLLDNATRYEATEGRIAAEADRVTFDFEGRIDGETFEGGKGDDALMIIGRGGFIPGFEEGIKGAVAGEARTLNVTFPEAYPVKTLAGKPAEFAVKVKEVAAPQRPVADDEFAKGFNFEGLDKLKEALRERLRTEYANASRAKAKRALLDALDARHSFELPPTLVEGEFNEIWKRLSQNLTQAGRTFADEGKTEESERAEMRKLAERRVRLGLLLSEIGEKNELKVSDEELGRSLAAQVRQYPGREKFVYDFYRKNPAALAQLRAPIFEDKVVSFVLELAKVHERTVTSEELFKDLEDDTEQPAAADAHDHDHDHHDHDHHDHDHHDHDHGAHGHKHD